MFTFLAPSAQKKHQPILPNCTECGLLSKCKNSKQQWGHPLGKKGVIVVNAPDFAASDLMYHNNPTLARLLSRVGENIRDWAIVPAAACPSAEATSWKHCQPLMMSTIKRLNPEKVLVFGKKSLQSLITRLWGHPSELTDRFIGAQIPSRELNAWVCPLGWIGQDSNTNPTVSDIWAYRHTKAAVKLQGRPYDTPPDYDSQVVICYDEDAIRAYLLRAAQSVLAAFDYETTGLKPEHPDQDIVTASFAWLENGQTFCVAFPMTQTIREAWVKFLQSPVPKVAANMKFEQRWSKQKLGTDINNLRWDTMINGHILNPTPGVAGLKFQAFVEMGLPFYAGEVEKFFDSEQKGGNAINNIHLANRHELLRYNGIDSIAELDLAILQRWKLGASTLWSPNLPKQEFYAKANNSLGRS
jgi:hypothetical protein